MNVIDIGLFIWFVATALSVGYIAYDLFTRTPEMKVMKWGWLLVALYTGPVAFVVYWFSCREPSLGTHEKFVAPLWKQSVGSTIHCLAGDATGIIVAASITSLLGFPMGIDSIIEYVSGFSFGLLIFQALFSRDLLGGSYAHAVRVTWLPEWLSMNTVMAGMIPTMAILMSRSTKAMEPTSARFWAVMSCASLVGATLAYPINWWLVKNGLKHGMGTERALGRGGSKVQLQAMTMSMSDGTPSPVFTVTPASPSPSPSRSTRNSSTCSTRPNSNALPSAFTTPHVLSASPCHSPFLTSGHCRAIRAGQRPQIWPSASPLALKVGLSPRPLPHSPANISPATPAPPAKLPTSAARWQKLANGLFRSFVLSYFATVQLLPAHAPARQEPFLPLHPSPCFQATTRPRCGRQKTVPFVWVSKRHLCRSLS
jgi:hypothetical protein